MMGSTSQELSVRIAQEMSAVLDVDDEWDRHQKIQRALQKQNFTINKLRVSDLDLFGRESEIQLLKDAFVKVVVETASTSKPKVALVNVVGRSGTGKTRLCQELKATVTNAQHNGFFLTGKFDLQNRQEPFTGLVSALSGLKEQVMARGGQELADALSSALREAIGAGDFRMLTSVVPCLEQLLIKAAPTATTAAATSSNNVNVGEAAAAAEAAGKVSSDPTPDAQGVRPGSSYDNDDVQAVDGNDRLTTRSSRLQYLFRQFFRCICRPEHPVVLLLDDMQWSDDATLTLLSTLVTDSSLSSLMVLATCREEEVHDEHPWNVLLRNVQTQHAKKVAVQQVALSSLDQPAVLNIVQTALRCTEERTFRLAEIVHSKSSGNAMYVIQFLSSLYDDGLLRYNVGSMSWMWDEHAVRSRFVTDNVVDLTTAKLQKLPLRMRTLLMMAACLGRTFDRSKLELIRRQERIKALLLLGSAAVVEEVEENKTAAATLSAAEEAALPEAPMQDSSDSKPPELAEASSSPSASEPESPMSVVDELVEAEKVGDEPATEEETVEEGEVVIDWLSAALHQLAEESVIEYLPELRTYCFAHDMIQEAASRLISDKVRGPVQREVGRALLQSHQLKELDDNFYFRAIELSNVVGSAEEVEEEEDKDDDAGDRHELARHNSEAGQRAMAKAAFGSALKYFEAGLRHLGNDGIRSDTTLFLELSSGAVEAAFCSGNSEALEKHIARAMQVDTPIENKVR
jgi:predicted ATPase